MNYDAATGKKIYEYLTGKGLNAFAVSGLMGNIYAESALLTNNLQDSYQKKLGFTDETYTAAVDNGTYGDFATDKAGYGLCQWTSSGRKQGLLGLCMVRECSVSDLTAQLDYLWKELNGDYTHVLNGLKKAATVSEAARLVMCKFEMPADQSEAKQLERVSYAEEIYKQYAETKTETITEDVQDMGEKVYKKLLEYDGYLEKKSNANLEHKTKNAGNKNYTIFAKLYKDYTGENYQAQAWCAMFISVCFVLAYGLAEAKRLLCGSLFAYCPYGMNAFKNKGRLHTKPKKYDVVFFLKNGLAYHTGFVYKVSGNTIYTIEGNTSGASGVIPNGGGVCKKSYTVNSNMRFGRPDYKEIKETETKKETKKPAAVEPAASFKESLAGKYTTTTDLYLRKGAGKEKEAIKVLPAGKTVQNFGYYTTVSGTKWLLVAVDGLTGFASSKYLKK